MPALGSLSTATARLGELSQQLVDHIGDARAHFYRAVFPRHRRDGLDPAIHDMTAAPTPEGETAVRRVEVLGQRYHEDVVDLVSDASAALESATLAGGGDWLEAWAGEQHDRLATRVHGELSNSQIAIHEAVGRFSWAGIPIRYEDSAGAAG